MSLSTIKATNLTATATVFGTRCRVRSIYNGATAGTVVLKDGGASGTTVFSLDMTAGQTIDLADLGLLFETDCHATLTTTDSVVVTYS